MRTIYIRNLFRGYLKKKWIIIVGLIVFVLIFGFLGLRRAYPERMDASLAEDVEEYNAELAVYDDAIDGIQTNIEIAEEQLAAQQEYVDHSPFMQIDPEAVQYASVQFIVRAPDAEEGTEDATVSSILTMFQAYYANGSFMSDLTERLGEDTTTYLQELISCSVSGKTMSLGVKHYDMDAAEEILDAMTGVMEDYQPAVEAQFGAFTMTSQGTSERVYADSDVLTNQNKQTTNLRTYRTNLTDLQTKLATQQKNRRNYVEQYQPTGTGRSARRTILIFGGMGVIAGIVIPLMIYAIYYTLSSRIKGKEELQAVNLNVLAEYHPRRGFRPSLEQMIVNLVLLARKDGVDAVSLCALGESDALTQVAEQLTEALEAEKLNVYAAQAGSENAEELQRLADIGHHVLIVESGRTTYTQVEEQIQFCASLDITMWGCVVIE